MKKKHKVFVSYHHANDQGYRDLFEQMCTDILVSKSVQIGDIDSYLKTETIRRKIRDEYLRDSTVTVVLIGAETWKRKHVDWEISSSIRDTLYNPRNGLIGILLPSHTSYGKNGFDPYTIPPRLDDNIIKGFAKLYDWSNNKSIVQDWIHQAFKRRQEIIPNNSRSLFTNNRSSKQDRWE